MRCASLSEAAAAAREELLAMSVATGLKAMHAMMQAEITSVAGPRRRHNPDRSAVCHGSAASSVTLRARRVPVSRPRAHTTDGAQVPLQTFAAFAGDDLLTETVMARMRAGLACRRFPAGSEPVGEAVEAEARSTSRSAVSRRFVRATQAALVELLTPDLSELQVAARLVDGQHIDEHLMVVALAMTTDGTKVPVGLVRGGQREHHPGHRAARRSGRARPGRERRNPVRLGRGEGGAQGVRRSGFDPKMHRV
jgi:hypothetical protein